LTLLLWGDRYHRILPTNQARLSLYIPRRSSPLTAKGICLETNTALDTVLPDKEGRKKRKHMENCHQNRRDFTPFLMSCDGMMATEAKAVTKILARKFANKWKASYSHVCARLGKSENHHSDSPSTNYCIHGSRLPYRDISSRYDYWEEGAGIGLFQQLIYKVVTVTYSKKQS